MKDHLKKTFSDLSWHIPIKGFITTENNSLAAGFDNLQLTYSYQDDAPNTTDYYPIREQQPNDFYRENNDDFQSFSRKHYTFYSKNNYRPITNHANPYYRTNQQSASRFQPHKQYAPQPNRLRQSVPKPYSVSRKKNPCARTDAQLRCLVCESNYHFAQNCPKTKSQDTFSQDIVFFETDYDHPIKSRNLISESTNVAILDSRATNTVTGESWMNTYIDNLEGAEKAKVRCRESKNSYHFGDGNTVSAIKNVDISITTANERVTLNTDIVQNDIPLLLSRKAMRTANMTLYFKNDNAIIFGEPEKLIVRKSGHYALPISPYNKILKNIVTGTNPNTALITISNKSRKDNARKLHRQFSYPTPAYNTSDNETPPISRVLTGRHLIFHSLTSPPCSKSPQKCTPVEYKKRQKVAFPIVT